jgi:hypothetical protein
MLGHIIKHVAPIRPTHLLSVFLKLIQIVGCPQNIKLNGFMPMEQARILFTETQISFLLYE